MCSPECAIPENAQPVLAPLCARLAEGGRIRLWFCWGGNGGALSLEEAQDVLRRMHAGGQSIALVVGPRKKEGTLSVADELVRSRHVTPDTGRL